MPLTVIPCALKLTVDEIPELVTCDKRSSAIYMTYFLSIYEGNDAAASSFLCAPVFTKPSSKAAKTIASLPIAVIGSL